MANVSQKYLKDENDEVFSPIISGSSVMTTGTNLNYYLDLHGQHRRMVYRQIDNIQRWYKCLEFDLSKNAWAGCGFKLDILECESIFCNISLNFAGRRNNSNNLGQYFFKYDNLLNHTMESGTYGLNDFVIIYTNDNKIQLYISGKGVNRTIWIIPQDLHAESYGKFVGFYQYNSVTTLPSGTQAIYPEIIKYS